MKDLLEKLNLDEKAVYAGCKAVAIVAAGFSLIICILLIANYLQTRAVDPLNSEPLDALVKRLDENPKDEALREQIRAVHLLSRKAYFINQWQLRTGGILLLVSVIVMVAALKIMENVRQQLPNPEDFPKNNDFWKVLEQARNWVVGLGIFVLGVAVIFAALSYREMGNAFVAKTEVELLSIDVKTTRHWPNFRGPGGLGVAMVEEAPVDWDIENGRNVLWKAPIPQAGFSSPIVWEDRLFLTGGNRETRTVFCFDTESGDILWQKALESSGENPSLLGVDEYAGFAAPTASTNGQYVCAIFATGDLACLDMEGNRVWAKNLGTPDNHYGHASSLIMYDNLLIVQYDQNSNSKLYAFDIASGSLSWEAKRSVISWSSPICTNTGNRVELILVNSKSVESYNPKTGDRLWSVKCMDGEMAPSPAYADGMVYVANDNARAVGIRLSGAYPEVVWEFDQDLPDTASPLATDKYLFIPTSYGYLICLDAKTGAKLWEAEFDYGFVASPVLAGSHVYALDKDGVMHIFEIGDEYIPVADIALGEKSDCTPAIVGGRIYIRGREHLYCIANESSGGSSGSPL